MHLSCRALRRARPSAGVKIDASIAMIKITTSISMSVKPDRGIAFLLIALYHSLKLLGTDWVGRDRRARRYRLARGGFGEPAHSDIQPEYLWDLV
jgi:hypothetical protein